MSDVSVIDLVKYASENKPMDFTTALDAVLGQKALEALEDRKQEIATNIFKDVDSDDTEEQETEDEVVDDEIETEDDEVEVDDEESEETGESDDQP